MSPESSNEKNHKCEECGEPIAWEARYCCDGRECGCKGLPIDPCWCGKCFDRIINGNAGKLCAYKGCHRQATSTACGRDKEHSRPAKYCFDHLEIVIEEGAPEYKPACPNCGCRFGVG